MSDMEPIITEGAQEFPQEEQSRNYEFEARQLGWKPLDEFKGDPAKHVSAEDFVEKSAGKVPLLEADRKKLLSRIAEMEKKFIKYAKSMDELEARGYERAMAEINAKQRAAVEVGDVEAFDAAQKERDKLQKKTEAESGDEPDPAKVAAFAKWGLRNPWFGTSQPLTEYADTLGRQFLKENKGSSLTDSQLEEIAQLVKDEFGEDFPELFAPKGVAEAEAPARKSAVGGVTPSRGKTARSAADLDSRARQVGESMVRMGIYKDLNEYAKELQA